MTTRKNNRVWPVIALLIAVGVFASGCSSRGMTAAEVNRRHERTIQNNLWQVQEDIDKIFLLDGPTRLSEQMIR
ncbi:MAG TPA: hypothetical protein ENN97_09875 [Phycisphaerales bacterium]|nr:hypothetical protein [Phycisphaerales bacterium]